MKLREEVLMRSFKKYRQQPVHRASIFAFSRNEARNVTELFCQRCREEVPVVLKDERICFMRTRTKLTACTGDVSALDRFVRRVRSIPARIKRKIFGSAVSQLRTIERGVYNTSPDHALFLREGLKGRIATARGSLSRAVDVKQRNFLQCAIAAMEALMDLTRRYAEEARRVGNNEMAAILGRVPAEPPCTLHEALQALRILQFALYLHGAAHCGLGRMDQYLLSFYQNDLSKGRLTREDAKELFAEFFISLNRDSDLYPGVQQGDNGQSVMLGGCNPETGESAVNDLTYLLIEVSRDVRLIDPKINLRIDRNTPMDLLELGCELTQCGLGFPQYSNDEVVIPALVKHGYKIEDARDYSVAACWEFVIPGKAMDMVNQGAVSFPYAVDHALRGEVDSGRYSEDSFRSRIQDEISGQVSKIAAMREVWHSAPFLSAFFDNSLETGYDIVEISPYKNIGIHGAGSANAADAMTAIQRIFDAEGWVGLKRLVDAQDDDFKSDSALHERLTNEMPKVGNADHQADLNLKFLFDAFSDAANRRTRNGRVIRPGSGSAMYYIWLTDTKRNHDWMLEPVVGATSDGRRLDAPLASSLAPAHEAKVGGVFGVLKSFSAIDYSRIVNGGPITIEFSHSIFRTGEGVKKLAQFIRYFVALGNQQLQLNVLNVGELEDALVHPELHRNLVVRVWGWSGYFCELDREFQMQIINRHRYGS